MSIFFLSLVNRVLGPVRNPPTVKKMQTFNCVPIMGNADLWVNILAAMQLFFFFCGNITRKQLNLFRGHSVLTLTEWSEAGRCDDEY